MILVSSLAIVDDDWIVEPTASSDPVVVEVPEDANVMTASEVVAHLRKRGARVRGSGQRGWKVTCPSHDDHDPSLHISEGGRHPVVFHCFAGCSQDDVLARAGLSWANVLSREFVHTPAVKVKGVRCDQHKWYDGWSEGLIDWVFPGLYTSHVYLRLFRPRQPQENVTSYYGRGARFDLPPDWVYGPTLELPQRIGRVMKAVLEDLVGLVNERIDSGETRAVPYASRWAAERIGEDDGRVRDAIRRLVRAGVLEKVGELPRLDGKRYDPIPLYALGVDAPCPLCACGIEAGPGVVRLDPEDAAATGNRQASAQPLVEQPNVAVVAVAEAHDLVRGLLATAVGVTGAVGHESGRYAEHRPPYDRISPRPFA